MNSHGVHRIGNANWRENSLNIDHFYGTRPRGRVLDYLLFELYRRRELWQRRTLHNASKRIRLGSPAACPIRLCRWSMHADWSTLQLAMVRDGSILGFPGHVHGLVWIHLHLAKSRTLAPSRQSHCWPVCSRFTPPCFSSIQLSLSAVFPESNRQRVLQHTMKLPLKKQKREQRPEPAL